MTSGTKVLAFDLTEGGRAGPSRNRGFEPSPRTVRQTDMPGPFSPNDLFATGFLAPSANPDEALRPAQQSAEMPVPASDLLLVGVRGRRPVRVGRGADDPKMAGPAHPVRPIRGQIPSMQTYFVSR